MVEQRDTVAAVGPPEAWVRGMIVWLEAEIMPALCDVVVLPPPGTAYDDVVHRAMKAVLGDRRMIWRNALLDFPAPASPAEVQVRAEMALAVAMTEAVRDGLKGTELAAFAVARLTLLKPYKPCQVWWGEGVRGHGAAEYWFNFNERTIAVTGTVEELGFCIVRHCLDNYHDLRIEDGAPVARWLKQQQGDWFLTREQVGELIQTGAIHAKAQAQAKAQATALVKTGGQ